MKRTLVVGFVMILLVSASAADGPLKSGPQVGEAVPGPFQPYNVTGENKGERHCLYCQMGTNPVAMIFAREVNPGVISLLKKIDAETAQNGKKNMGSFVVFLGNQENLDKELVKMAAKEKIKTTILSIDGPNGPIRYNVAKDAEVTVVLYNEHKVLANHAFRKGELSEQAIKRILADVPKILGK